MLRVWRRVGGNTAVCRSLAVCVPSRGFASTYRLSVAWPSSAEAMAALTPEERAALFASVTSAAKTPKEPVEEKQAASEEAEEAPVEEEAVGLDEDAPAAIPIVPLSHKVSVYGPDGPRTIERMELFDELKNVQGFPSWLLRNVLAEGYPHTTPVQGVALPVLNEHCSLIALAPTGSGKTVAFAIPSIVHAASERQVPSVRKSEDGRGMVVFPKVLVMCPSRELVQQTVVVYMRLLKASGLMVKAAYGGTDVRQQFQQMTMQAQAHVLVATPGRLKQYMDEGNISLKETKYMVLDEADRMLEMGFEKVLEDIFESLADNPTVMMWTATWPKGAKAIAERYMPANTVRIRVQQEVRITQSTYVTNSTEQKVEHIKRLYTEGVLDRSTKVIIFANRKDTIKELYSNLEDVLHPFRITVRSLHGDLNQAMRDKSMKNFRSGECQVLIASDVAARGIDVPIECVINFDMADDIEKFMHRIGRTGRAGRTGIAYNFIDDTTKGHVVRDLIEKLEKLNQDVPPELRDLHVTNRGVKGKFHAKFQGEEREGGDDDRRGGGGGGNRRRRDGDRRGSDRRDERGGTRTVTITSREDRRGSPARKLTSAPLSARPPRPVTL